MARTCTICRHPKRAEIEKALLDGLPLRTISDQWSVSKTALLRHRKNDLPTAILKAKASEEVTQADGLLARIEALARKAQDLGALAEKKGDLRTALVAVRELVRITQLLADISGKGGPDRPEKLIVIETYEDEASA